MVQKDVPSYPHTQTPYPSTKVIFIALNEPHPLTWNMAFGYRNQEGVLKMEAEWYLFLRL